MPNRAQIRDAAKVTAPAVLVIGFTAAAASLLPALLAMASIGRMSSMFGRETPAGIGLVALLLSYTFAAYGYSFIFWSAHRSGFLIGLNLSFFHWAIAGFISGITPAFQPLVAGLVAEPGFFLTGAGLATSASFFLGHLIYGGVFGWLFDRAAIRNTYPASISAHAHPLQAEWSLSHRTSGSIS